MKLIKEYVAFEWVERLETDGDSCELIGLEVNPWIPEDRPKKITEHLVEVLT